MHPPSDRWGNAAVDEEVQLGFLVFQVFNNACICMSNIKIAPITKRVTLKNASGYGLGKIRVNEAKAFIGFK